MSEIKEKRLLDCLALGGKVAREPVESFIKSVSRSGDRALDEPVSLAERVESELVGDFSSVHRVGEILLVGENKEDSVSELVLAKHSVQFVTGLADTLSVVAIDNEDDSLSVLVVVTPERSDLVLSSNIPNRERNVFVFDGFDVESDGGDRGNDLTELQLVQDRGLSGGICYYCLVFFFLIDLLLFEFLSFFCKEKKNNKNGDFFFLLTKSDHQNTDFLLAEESFEKFRESCRYLLKFEV